MKRNRKCPNCRGAVEQKPGKGRPAKYCSSRCRLARWRDDKGIGGARVIAALYVETGGPYCGYRGIRAWDSVRDARRYPGPYPVIAHPPCARWSQLADLVQVTHGYKVGDDGGCFASALEAVRRWGGVLEHPRLSHAWPAHGIASPPAAGGWIEAGDGIGFTCEVDQGHYGHIARKRTWLYAVGCDLPPLVWGVSAKEYRVDSINTVNPHGNARRCGAGRYANRKRHPVPTVTGKAASRTPLLFRDLLIMMARSVNQRRMRRAERSTA